MKIVIVTIFMVLCLFPAYRNHRISGNMGKSLQPQF